MRLSAVYRSIRAWPLAALALFPSIPGPSHRPAWLPSPQARRSRFRGRTFIDNCIFDKSKARGAFGKHLEEGCKVLSHVELTIAKFAGPAMVRKVSPVGGNTLQHK